MKKEAGITIFALVITILLMAILIGATVNYGVNSLETIKFQNFRYELEQVQGKVDTMYEKIKLGETDKLMLGSNVTDNEKAKNTLEMVRGINYSNILESQKDDYYYQDVFTYYRYLTQYDIQNLFDISSEPGDMIINFKTRDVISVDGFTFDDRTYYSLKDMK